VVAIPRLSRSRCFPSTTLFRSNKPFAEAIDALQTRFAYRQVDRRVLYIDPDPAQPPPPPSGRTPGFFATLRGALSDLPRNQPIRSEDHTSELQSREKLVCRLLL